MSFTDFCRLPPSVLVCALASEGSDELDELTSAVLCASTLVLGTRRGLVWALREGESLPSEVWRHNSCVLAIAVDESGNFVASSASDGSVAVSPLLSGIAEGEPRRSRWVCTYSRPVLSIAFSPRYASGAPGSQVLCVGGEECKLLINRRGAFECRNTLVHHGEGAITCVSWRGTLIAWANAKGVKIVDVETYQKVTNLPRPPADGCSNDAAARLTWHGDDVLLIGWGSVVVVVEVVRQKAGGPAGVRFASVLHCFSLSTGTISGIVAFDSTHLAILTTGNGGDNAGETSSDTIAYHICASDGRVLSSDSLPIDASNRNPQLVSGGDGCISYIVGAREIIATKRRGISSHVTWLINEGEYEAAIALASHSGSLWDAAQKGQICGRCISPLLTHGESDRAARLVQQLDIVDAETWLQCICAFDQAGALLQLVAVMPAPPSAPSLPCEVYDKALRSLAAVSPQALLAALERWPVGTYSAGPLQAILRDMLPHADMEEDGGSVLNSRPFALHEHNLLVKALASLHEAQGDRVSAADLLLQVGTCSLFPFLARHLSEDPSLGLHMQRRIAQLFDLNTLDALDLFVQNSTAFPSSVVVEALGPFGRFWQHRYLSLLSQRDAPAARTLRSVRLALVAEFEPHNLCSLLEQFQHEQACVADDAEAEGRDEQVSELEPEENVEEILALSRICGAVDAEVLLLARKGLVREALQLCLTRLNDACTALRLLEKASAELAPKAWEDFVSFAVGNPQAFTALSLHLGATAQPPVLSNSTQAALFKRIPQGLGVARLASHAEQAVKDTEADRDVHAASLEVLQRATASISMKLVLTQRRGVAVAPAGRAPSERLTETEPTAPGLITGAPWHKIRAPHFQLAFGTVLRTSIRAAVDNL